MSTFLTRTIQRRMMVSLTALMGSTVLASGAVAQSVQAPTREELERGQLEQRLQTQGQAVSVDNSIERAPCPLSAPQFGSLHFTLSDAKFAGLDVVDPALVKPAYSDLIGKDLPVAAICEIRDRAATLLRQRGYLAAVQVPVQEISQGVVRFDVVLARMAEVQVRGDPGPSGSQLQKFIDKLVGQPVFNIQDAERYLLLARDIPGLDVRLVLQPVAKGPATRPGDVIGVFNVARTPIVADANVQNFGSTAVGRFGGLARVRVNGLTGLADETTVSFYTTEQVREQKVLQIGHEFQLGGEGLRLGANGTFAWSKPDVAGPDLFTSDTTLVSAYATFPFKRAQASNLIGSVGFDVLDQSVRFSGQPLSRDHLRVVYARLDFNRIDPASLIGQGGYSAQEPRFAVGGSVEIRRGLGILGASSDCGPSFTRCTSPGVVPLSRLDGNPQGFVVRADARIDFRPTPQLIFTLKPRGQYSPDSLLSFEQLAGGNYTAGRGFDPGSVIGDSGFGGQVEIAYGSLMPKTPGGIAVQPYAFFDLMNVYSKNGPDNPQTITSMGGGLRANLGRRAMLDIFGAVPLKTAPLQASRGDFRLLVNLTVQLAPWKK